MDLWLGERLRARRTELGLPLQQVADRCGISVSLLSQMERGLRSISLRTLNGIAQALGVPAETLVRNAQPRPATADAADAAQDTGGLVLRAGLHPLLEQADKGIQKENLTPPQASGGLGMFRAVIRPGGSTGPELFSTDAGEQIGYVIEGQLQLYVHDQLLDLRAGDSFYYEGRSRRRWHNPGPGPTVVLWAIAR